MNVINPQSWRDRYIERWETLKDEAGLSRRQMVVIGVLAAASLSGGLIAARQSRIHPVIQEKPRIVRAKAPLPIEKSYVYVHVSGGVFVPGLYRLPAGARIDEAIKAAGGIKPDGAPDSVNLAAKVHDGQKIAVPLKAAGVDAAANGPPETAEQGRTNLNTATAEQLDRLDGIGPVLAKRIIAWRERHGRFSTVRQLDDVQGIGAKKYALIKDAVVVE